MSKGRLILRSVLGIAFTGALLMVPAGRWDYWQGWVVLGITLLRLVLAFAIFKDNPELVDERVKPGPGTKWWDKVFYAIYTPAFLAVVVIGALDSGRYGWTGDVSLVIYIAGFVLHALSHVIVFWAMKVNTFFSSTVRIQSDRGQIVIKEGPYKYVRHPGYVGAILMVFSTAMLLGSYWAMLPAGLVVISLIVRTALEDRTLANELDGYLDYRKQVKYRLLPGIF